MSGMGTQFTGTGWVWRWDGDHISSVCSSLDVILDPTCADLGLKAQSSVETDRCDWILVLHQIC